MNITDEITKVQAKVETITELLNLINEQEPKTMGQVIAIIEGMHDGLANHITDIGNEIRGGHFNGLGHFTGD